MPRPRLIPGRLVSCAALAAAAMWSCENEGPSTVPVPSPRAPTPGVISGVVFDDAVTDGTFDPTLEVGLGRQNVWVYSVPFAGPPRFVAAPPTDPLGRFVLGGLAAGVYSLTVHVPAGWTRSTDDPMLVTLVEDDRGDVLPFDDAEFGLFDPDPPDSSIIFHGWVGTDWDLDSTFVNPPAPAGRAYVLHVGEPVYVRAPVGAIGASRVWINGALAWEIQCGARTGIDPCTTSGRSTFGARVELPPGLVSVGSNDVRIEVDGWGEPFWIFSIWRIRDLAGP